MKILLMHRRATRSLFFLIVVLVLLGLPHHEVAAAGDRLIVSPAGPYTSVTAALADASDGDTIEVQGGVYAGPLLVDKTVDLIGVDNPVIDGGRSGTIVVIEAPDVVFQGFTLRNSGDNLHHEDSGIVAQAPRVTIADNLLEEVLFGIYLPNAPEGIVRNNTIIGKDLDLPSRGDGIRVWFSNDVTLAGNTVTNTRDTLIWYAENIVIENNHFHDNRYGIHFMYSSGAQIENNLLEHNSVGAFLMYSSNVTLALNTFNTNRGPSGYGIALKAMDDAIIEDNLFTGNRVGFYADDSPSSVDSYNLLSGNLFFYNDIGVMALPAIKRNIFTSNSFVDNIQQVSTRGRGSLQGNSWVQDGQGNYWSDYAGYDENRDGIGEMAYRAEEAFESLTDIYPELRLFTYSPASQAINFAANAFPTLRPEPKLIDEAPLMQIAIPAHITGLNSRFSGDWGSAFLLLVGIAGGIVLLARIKRQVDSNPQSVQEIITDQIEQDDSMLVADKLTKRYGDFVALDSVSFAIQPGEAVALWGANGAGKTTAIKSILGLQPYEGQLRVNDIDVHQHGKAVRSMIGYVPQEAVFYDLTVQETLAFYARLKKAPLTQIDEVLEQVHLTEHSEKPVSALSGGMKQRLALGVALLSDPSILVMDEPTANLDARSRYDFLHLVKALNQTGKTIVFASHRFDEVEVLANRVLILQDGQLAFECPPAELADKLGLDRWLRIEIAPGQFDTAVELLCEEGYTTVPNEHALYVPAGTGVRMAPLRLLETARIPVQDFDLVDANALPTKGEEPCQN